MQKLPILIKLQLNWFRVGLALRILTAPFLLQWLHPDERQMLEFAHFHSHGRLHPFMEVTLQLRNQTLPWLFSWLIRFCDCVGINSPWAYLTLIHLVISIGSWLGLCALVKCFQISHPKSKKTAQILGWFFAVFWAFPFFYSRPLLEAVSFPCTCFLLLAIRRSKLGHAGFWAGAASILRYPSALWSMGAFLITYQKLAYLKYAILGFGLVFLLGGLADWASYGKFLASAPAYWAFNHPHGPVELLFGNDSLFVYWRWFEFLLTPWLAPFFLGIALFALLRNRELFLFTLPYLIGHIWTPHREPRFMLPIMPILALALAEAYSERKLEFLNQIWKKFPSALKKIALGIYTLHILLNFAWYPLNVWAQWKSAQGTLIRHWNELSDEKPASFVTLSDPVIDVFIPPSLQWTDSNCQWHRPPLPNSSKPSRLWVLSFHNPALCKKVESSMDSFLPDLKSATLQRIFRVRAAYLWDCPLESLKKICSHGILEPPPNEPLFSLMSKL